MAYISKEIKKAVRGAITTPVSEATNCTIDLPSRGAHNEVSSAQPAKQPAFVIKDNFKHLGKKGFVRLILSALEVKRKWKQF